MVMRADAIDRFLAIVDKQPDGCWLWTGWKKKGYGKWRPNGIPTESPVYAHRFAYEFYVGPIPSGLQLDHLCEVRSCVNPEHLEPVTAAENARRAHPFCAAKSPVCKNGHQWADNAYSPPNSTSVVCRACTRQALARSREKHRKPPAPPKLHCKWNHEFTPENTYVRGEARICRACNVRRSTLYRKRKSQVRG